MAKRKSDPNATAKSAGKSRPAQKGNAQAAVVAPSPNPGDSPADQDQRQLITHELDKNILVEAAAGTGKTTSLIARMVNLIRQGKCTIDKLAAVTYTRKAAAELRARFQITLEKSARDASGIERDWLLAAVANIERCYLGTIHSFCARLLRERPVEAGVDAAFRELDEAADFLLRRQAWDEHVAHLIASDDPILTELENLGLDVSMLAPAFHDMANYPDVTEWPVPTATLPDPQPVITALKAYANRMRSLIGTFPDNPGNDKLMPRYRLTARMVQQANLERPVEILEIIEQFSELKSNAIVQKNWPGGGAQAKDELEEWNRFNSDHAAGYVAAWRLARYRPALSTIRPALERYERKRREAGGLNFQDLLLTSARLLRDKPRIRAYFRSRFSHVLVDEFQDTDPVQAEVMLLLTADDPAQTDWRQCRPVSGSLFVVGDPKQSIYRFRRADIVTYTEVKRLMVASGGLVASLTANFRTTPKLIHWINQSFADGFPDNATEFAPARCALQVGRAGDEAGELHGVYILNVPGANKIEATRYEANFIARTIRDAIDKGRTVPRSSKELKDGVPPFAVPGDFLIVTRNTKHLSVYARELQELGVPHQVTGGTALNELDELGLLYQCLNAVVRPDDPVALVATLRSELFGISDQSLYAYRQAKGTFAFRSSVPATGLPPADAAIFQDAFDRLSRYDRWLKTLPPSVAFERIVGDLGLLVRACADSGGDVRAGTLAKALQVIRDAETEVHSVADLVEYLGQLVNQDEKHDGISVRPHTEPVVRLMNLHKVKGLEAPVVFLADPSGEWEHNVRLHIDRVGEAVRGYLAIYEPKQGNRPQRLLACPQNWEQLAAREMQFQDAENNRLLYVAATRAGTCLTIAQRDNKNNQNPWQFFEAFLTNQSSPSDPGTQAAPLLPAIDVASLDVSSATSAIDQRWEALRRPTYDSQAIKEIALTSPLPALERAYAPTGEHGVEWGTLIHALLEAVARSPSADLHALARTVSRDQDISTDILDAAVQTVQAVQKSEVWQRAKKSERWLVEVPVQFLVSPADATSGLPTIQRGVIDLLFLEPTGWVVVDYKTDDVALHELPRLVDHYRPQVKSYAEAWQRLIQQPVCENGLFFTRTNCYLQA